MITQFVPGAVQCLIYGTRDLIEGFGDSGEYYGDNGNGYGYGAHGNGKGGGNSDFFEGAGWGYGDVSGDGDGDGDGEYWSQVALILKVEE